MVTSEYDFTSFTVHHRFHTYSAAIPADQLINAARPSLATQRCTIEIRNRGTDTTSRIEHIGTDEMPGPSIRLEDAPAR
jgi:hypothetical protein